MNSHESVIQQAAATFPVNPPSKKDARLRRRRSIIREFSLNTSTHGIPGIARSESIHNRIFWTVAFVIFLGIMLYFIVEAIVAYFQYPTQTTVELKSERSQLFPAFTFCNGGGVRYDMVLQGYLDYLQNSNLTGPSGADISSATLLPFIMLYLPILINSGLPIDTYTFSLESMLIQCVYADNPCTAKDFTSFYSATYGRCYTFNAKTKNNTLFYSYSNSGLGVLSLRLYLYDHLYISYRSEGVAMMAMVHDNTQLPTIERAGMTLAPGFKHRLTYTKKSVYSLPPPYSSCTSDIPLSMQSMFDKYDGADYAYSEDICYIICQQTYVYMKCGCVSPTQWNVRSIILPGTSQVISVPLCNTTNQCFGPATFEFEVTPSIINEYCTDCAQQCSITSFSVKSSIATTPPDWLIPMIKSFVENSSMPLPSDWNTQWQTHIKASYLSVDLLSESTLVENYTQTATMGFVDVLSNIGGQTGLWIGISFLSLMEFVEMIYRLIRYHFYLIERAKQKKINNPVSFRV